jgi:hypothetical protein
MAGWNEAVTMQKHAPAESVAGEVWGHVRGRDFTAKPVRLPNK